MELTDKNIKNFWKKVDKKGEFECWEWIACKDKNGYGLFGVDKKLYKSHRISWILENGEIPKDDSFNKTLYVLHKCDNPGCVNPNHLFLGTNKDNMIDMVKKGRNYISSGEKNGMSKKIEQEVLEIRQKYLTGLYTQKELSEEYSISRAQIQRIVNNKQWKHI